MKKLLAVLLAVLMLCGGLAVGAGAISSAKEIDDELEKIGVLIGIWCDDNGINLEQVTDKFEKEKAPQLDAFWDLVNAERYDEALALYKTIAVMELLIFVSAEYDVSVPDSLWDLVGGNPAGPGTDPGEDPPLPYLCAICGKRPCECPDDTFVMIWNYTDPRTGDLIEWDRWIIFQKDLGKSIQELTDIYGLMGIPNDPPIPGFQFIGWRDKDGMYITEDYIADEAKFELGTLRILGKFNSSSSEQPSIFAKVWDAILKWFFFGWLWNR